jgi:HEAT repeat protein
VYQGKTLTQWIKALKGKDVATREKAARALGVLGPRAKTAAPALRQVLEDKNISVTAAEALWKVDKTAFIQVLKNKRQAQSRWAAVLALSNLGNAAREVTPLVVAIAKDERDSDRPHALLALGNLGGDPKVILPVLTAALRDQRGQYARIMAAQGLGCLGSKAKTAVPQLKRALEDEDAQVRVDAAGALWRVAKKADLAVPVLIKALAKDSGADRYRAMFYLGKIGKAAHQAVPALLAVWKDPKDGQREQAAKALKAIDPKAAAKAGIK